MKHKIFAIILSLTAILTMLYACTPSEKIDETTKPWIDPTKYSDSDSVNAKTDHDIMEEKLAVMNSAFEVKNKNEFKASLADGAVTSLKYISEDDIKIKNNDKIEKTFSISTDKEAFLECPANTVIIEKAIKGFKANSPADTIIINGADITTSIKAECGSIYITGKNANVHIYSNAVEKIFAYNASAMIINHTDSPVAVTLINGVKTEVPAGYTYSAADGIVEGSPEA